MPCTSWKCIYSRVYITVEVRIDLNIDLEVLLLCVQLTNRAIFLYFDVDVVILLLEGA